MLCCVVDLVLLLIYYLMCLCVVRVLLMFVSCVYFVLDLLFLALKNVALIGVVCSVFDFFVCILCFRCV